MQSLKFTFGTLCLGFLLLISCNDPSLIGSDLLEEDQFNIRFSDSVRFEAKTVFGDSVRTYDTLTAGQLFNYQFGRIDDPVFGPYSSTIYVEFQLNGGQIPSFEGETFDSAVLILPFDGFNTYGDPFGKQFEMEILRLGDPLDEDMNHYSDEVVMSTTLLETVTFTVDSSIVEINDPETGELDTLPAHIRIPVPSSLANEIFTADSIDLATNDEFQAFFPGLAFRPTTSTEGMIGIQLRAPTPIAPLMQFFHHSTEDTTTYLFPIGTSAAKFTTFDHEFGGTVVEDFVNQGAMGGDSLLFLQAMEGANIELDFTNLDDFQNIVVNKAELIIPLDSFPGDDESLAPPIDFLIANQIDETGELILIEDLQFIFFVRRLSIQDQGSLYGGFVDEDDNSYHLNITTHFQRMIDGETTNRMMITPYNSGGDGTIYNRGDRASRSILRGPGNAKGGMRLDLFFTKI